MSTIFETVVILDFGAQYTQLIARRIREAGVFCEIHPFNSSVEKIKSLNPKGIILSGGPASVYEKDAPHCASSFLDLGIPVLGICYGLQLLSYFLDGKVEPSPRREYGAARARLTESGEGSLLFKDVPQDFSVWMSHGDQVTKAPGGFVVLAETDNAISAVANPSAGLYGLQFHPEVAHTPDGKTILANFLKLICGCTADWSPSSFVETSIARIRDQIGKGNAVCGLSGGVDSAVAAALVSQAIGARLTCLFVDNGLLRKNEFTSVLQSFRAVQDLNVVGVAAGKRFLSALKGVDDPEKNGKLLGGNSLRSFRKRLSNWGNMISWFRGHSTRM